ncbi:MAG: hypothetical protein ABI425_01110 [Patescibacteria group bacterium]
MTGVENPNEGQQVVDYDSVISSIDEEDPRSLATEASLKILQQEATRIAN